MWGPSWLGVEMSSTLKIKKPYLTSLILNVTENISSQAILRHNNIFNRYLPALLYLPSTTPFMRASARELLVPFFTTLVWCGCGIRTHDLPLRKGKLYQLSSRDGYPSNACQSTVPVYGPPIKASTMDKLTSHKNVSL